MRLAGRRTQTVGGILICFVLSVRSFIREAALIIVAGTHWANRSVTILPATMIAMKKL